MTMPSEAPPADLRERLDRIDRKLDRLLERQDMVEDLVVEFTPIVRDMMKVGGERLAEWERAGWFERGARLADLLTLADDAADVVEHAGDLKPVGMVGMMRATGDGDVQHGMAVAIEILRHLGRARLHATRIPGPAGSAPEAIARPVVRERAPEACHVEPPKADPQRVEWEGHTFDGQGFLVDPATWNEDLCQKMAAALGVTLTDDHWTVIRWVRADFAASGASPNVRRTAAGCGLGTKRLYELFPKTPGKTAALLAGVPKPVGCV
jgi:tRNA 2-thiouridine synthesizing protein E